MARYYLIASGFPFDIPLAGRNFYGELRFRF